MLVQDGYAPLHVAARRVRAGMVKALLSAGANWEAVTPVSGTPAAVGRVCTRMCGMSCSCAAASRRRSVRAALLRRVVIAPQEKHTTLGVHMHVRDEFAHALLPLDVGRLGLRSCLGFLCPSGEAYYPWCVA